MRLRTAMKIRNAIDTPRESAYSRAQLNRALARFDRTRSAREDHDFFWALMRRLGPPGRAHLLARLGKPGMALDLLMRTPEDQWQ